MRPKNGSRPHTTISKADIQRCCRFFCDILVLELLPHAYGDGGFPPSAASSVTAIAVNVTSSGSSVAVGVEVPWTDSRVAAITVRVTSSGSIDGVGVAVGAGFGVCVDVEIAVAVGKAVRV